MNSIWLPEIRKHRAAAARLKKQIDRASSEKLRTILDELAHHNREIRRLTCQRYHKK